MYTLIHFRATKNIVEPISENSILLTRWQKISLWSSSWRECTQ